MTDPAPVSTTHAGSLPRPETLLGLLLDGDGSGDDIEREIGASVRATVRRQVETGIDIVSDGEMSKITYATYVKDRLAGLESGELPAALARDRKEPRDTQEFPEIREARARRQSVARRTVPLYCAGPVSYADPAPLRRDLHNFESAVTESGPRGAFLTAASPGVLANFIPNAYYPSEDAYVEALAHAMREEYRATVDAGFSLQIDCPDLAMSRHGLYQDLSTAEFRRIAARNVEALNAATSEIPGESMRLHVCWGNYPGPHTHDIAVGDILDIVCTARPQGLVFEAANPRHEHEWEDWARGAVPDDKILIPGVIDSTTNFVEHPRLVAQRIRRFVNAFGRDRIIAGTDCGFGTFAGRDTVYDSVAWAKLRALVEGAALEPGLDS